MTKILSDLKQENEAIFTQIEDEFTDNECESKAFVRALIVSFCKSCYSESKIDHDLLQRRTPILSKYISKNEELELEALFAVQALDFRMKHQPGFIRLIFDFLYDEDIVREDVFWQWKENVREEGHQICAFSLKGFYEWLSEADNIYYSN